MPSGVTAPYKDWPHVRVKRGTYRLIHDVAQADNLHITDLLEQSINAWIREKKNRESLVELETFLRELRAIMVTSDATLSQAVEIQTCVISHLENLAQLHAVVREMLHGI